MTSKEECKEFALKYKEQTGKFDKFWADKFKVSPSTITSVRLNNSWKDVIVGENK
jgi:hypothetical protein